MHVVGRVQMPWLQVQIQTHHLPHLKLQAITMSHLRVGNMVSDYLCTKFLDQVMPWILIIGKGKKNVKSSIELWSLHNGHTKRFSVVAYSLIRREDACCHQSLMSMSWLNCNVNAMFGDGHMSSCVGLFEVGTRYLYFATVMAQW